MLLQFKVSNYRSIGEEQTLSLVPSSSNSEFLNNIFKDEKYAALNVVSMYGSNSSGKSNILKAIHVLEQLVLLSSRTNSTALLPYDPNLLVEGFSNKPTQLEIIFVVEGIRYRYGIEYNLNEILKEHLFRKKVGREVELFYREKSIIDVSSGLSGKSIRIDAAIDSTRSNSLFLSACDQFNIDEAKIVYSWFNKLINIDGLNTKGEEFNTLKLLEQGDQYKLKIGAYLKNLDLGFHGIKVKKKIFDPNDVAHIRDENMRKSIINQLDGQVGTNVETIHYRYSSEGEIIDKNFSWAMEKRESAGTLKAFQLSGPVVFALFNGATLIIDEIEAKLHTKLTQSIISLFLNQETNPKKAQLIFATHDTNLLDALKMRRDQINFVEKNKLASTEIYSLSDIVYKDGKKERIETDKEKRYLEDRYGATPNIRFLSNFMEE